MLMGDETLECFGTTHLHALFRFLSSLRLVKQRKRHYWILDWKSVTLYQNESSTKYYKVGAAATSPHLHV